MITSNYKTLNQFILKLQELVKEEPKLGELPCIYFSDAEGNSWEYLRNSPCTALIEDGGVTTDVSDNLANAICLLASFLASAASLLRTPMTSYFLPLFFAPA